MDSRTFINQTIDGRYRVLRLLGEGGMGAVYECEHTNTKRRVAVKLLLPYTLRPEIQKRFEREAVAAGTLENPHIAQVFDSGKDGESGAPYLAMEYLRGYDVEQLSSRLGALDPEVAVRIMRQACRGVAHAHRRGVIHRDIKPANLFLDHKEGGEVVVKLLDFGIAKIRMGELGSEGVGLTQTGSVLGTPLYMSPEQADGAKHIDERTDVWSLGAVFFQLLTGRPPFEEPSLARLIVAITTRDPPAIQSVAAWVDPAYAQIVDGALQRDNDKRLASADAMLELLEALPVEESPITKAELTPLDDSIRDTIKRRIIVPVGDSGVSVDDANAAGVASTYVWTSPELETGRRRRKWLLGIGLAAAVVAGVAYLAVGRDGGADAGTGSVETADTTAEQPDEREVLVGVPGGVRVFFSGSLLPVQDGEVVLKGEVGSKRIIELESADGQRREVTIAITDDGAFPRDVEVASPAPASPEPASSTETPPVHVKEPPPAVKVAPNGSAPAVVAGPGKPPPPPPPDTAPPPASSAPAPSTEFEL